MTQYLFSAGVFFVAVVLLWVLVDDVAGLVGTLRLLINRRKGQR